MPVAESIAQIIARSDTAKYAQDKILKKLNEVLCRRLCIGTTMLFISSTKKDKSQNGTSPTAAIPHETQSFGTDKLNSIVDKIVKTTIANPVISQIL